VKPKLKAQKDRRYQNGDLFPGGLKTIFPSFSLFKAIAYFSASNPPIK